MPEQNALSDREQEILQLVATGLTNREIAQNLNISPNTVKVHLSNIFEKINVASRTEATLYGIEHGIVDVPGVDNGETQLSFLEVVKKYLWIFIPIGLVIIALLGVIGRTLLFPAPTPTPAALAEIPERWQELAPMPEARANMAAVAYDGNIYAIAGDGSDGVSGSVFRYLTTEDRWERLQDKPTPVADVEGALIGEKVYVPGGRLGEGSPTDILEIYDPRQDTWEEGAPLPKAISAYAMADFEGKLYLFGGWDGEQALADVYVYDPEEDTWREGTAMTIPRRDAGAVALADKIVVLGGRDNTISYDKSTTFVPSRDNGNGNPWDIFIKMPSNLYNFGLAAINETIYIIGGFNDEGILDDKESGWLLVQNEWFSLPTNQIYLNYQTKLISIGTKLIVIKISNDFSTSQIWSYQVYYNIYIPFVP